MDVSKLKEDWVGFAFDEIEFDVEADELLDYAGACGETDPRFMDVSHADFQAPVNYTARFVGRRMFPENFPRFGRGGFDAGKCVESLGPIRPGDRLVARSLLHDIYEKTGRSGGMVFIVHRMEFRNQQEALVSVVDWRMVIQT